MTTDNTAEPDELGKILNELQANSIGAEINDQIIVTMVDVRKEAKKAILANYTANVDIERAIPENPYKMPNGKVPRTIEQASHGFDVAITEIRTQLGFQQPSKSEGEIE